MTRPEYPRFPLLTSAASTNMTRSTCGLPEESEANLTPALAGSLGMLALIMVGLRIGWRTGTKKTFGWDDGFILLAMVCTPSLHERTRAEQSRPVLYR